MGQLLYTGSIAGVSFEPQRTNLKEFLNLMMRKREENNLDPRINLEHYYFQHPKDKSKDDPNAIAVHAGQEDEFYFVGHIPRTHNYRIVEKGMENVQAFLEDFNLNPDGDVVGLSIEVYEKDQ